MVELGGWLSAAACQAIFWGSLRLSIRQVPRLERLFLTSPTNGLPLSPLFGLAPSHCCFSLGIGNHGDEEEVERLDCRLRQGYFVTSRKVFSGADSEKQQRRLWR